MTARRRSFLLTLTRCPDCAATARPDRLTPHDMPPGATCLHPWHDAAAGVTRGRE